MNWNYPIQNFSEKIVEKTYRVIINATIRVPDEKNRTKKLAVIITKDISKTEKYEFKNVFETRGEC